MNNKLINYKLANFCLLALAVAIVYSVRGLWGGVVDKVISIIFPFLLAFTLAYIAYPFTRKMQDKGIPKYLSVTIITVLTVGFLVLLVMLIIPLLYDQIIIFVGDITVFLKEISSKFNVDVNMFQTTLTSLTTNIGKYISDGAIGVINASFGIIAATVIVLFVSIYFLSDMDKIRDYIKVKLKSSKSRSYNYVKNLDTQMSNYFTGMGLNMLYQLVEYTTIYFIIGHPSYLLLGVLSAFSNIIPYFGGFIVNIIALIVASTISTQLTILTLIVCLICPNIDSYVISPRVYGKTNKLHPLVNIFAVFAGGVLLGFWGIVISLPVAIIVITTYKFFRNDISNKIDNIKKKV
ncbi:MAG: AI-2E family transporter [bacterium]|nr:AI-2E family transporter [bacterium]